MGIARVYPETPFLPFLYQLEFADQPVIIPEQVALSGDQLADKCRQFAILADCTVQHVHGPGISIGVFEDDSVPDGECHLECLVHLRRRRVRSDRIEQWLCEMQERFGDLAIWKIGAWFRSSHGDTFQWERALASPGTRGSSSRSDLFEGNPAARESLSTTSQGALQACSATCRSSREQATTISWLAFLPSLGCRSQAVGTPRARSLR